jgi:uncharacterized protein YqgV (UPF0045/DUF77 family)
MIIQAELSLYPLRESHLGPYIDGFLKALRREGIAMTTGTMSTVISGEREIVFAAVADGFARVSHHCDVVLHVTYSNACPSCPGFSCVTSGEEP